jgi:hypothetical protein
VDIAALFVAVVPVSVGAAMPATDAPEAASQEESKAEVLDEVLVQGTRRWTLRQQMIAVEDRFYALYDELNKDSDFDVHCHIEVPTGRIIKERVCRVAFHENAQEVEVNALRDGHSAPPADVVAQARSADFEKHFLQVVNSDPRLRKLVRERETLGKMYGESER